jgi:hypothetical protein
MRYRPDPDWEAGLRGQPQFQAAIGRITQEVGAAVRMAAEPSRHTGYFIRKITVIGNRVELRDPFWHLVEYGSRKNPAYAPARRGVRMAGLRFNDPRNPG